MSEADEHRQQPADEPREGQAEDPDHQPPASVRRRLLEHPTRKRIVELLDQRPGLNKNQLNQHLGLHHNVLDFHLDALEAAGVLGIRPSAQDREYLCFLQRDLDLWEDERTRVLYGRSPVRHVAHFLAQHPGATVQEIAEELGRSTVTIRHHLETLEDHGLVERFRAGRVYLYEPGDELAAWVADLGDRFEVPWRR